MADAPLISRRDALVGAAVLGAGLAGTAQAEPSEARGRVFEEVNGNGCPA